MTDPKTDPAPEEPAEPILPLRDPDGDGKPGVSWPAAAIIIAALASLSALLYFGKLPNELLVLLLGGVGEHIRGKVARPRKPRA